MRFVILGIHQPGFVPGVKAITARVRMFPGEDRKTFADEDFELPKLDGFTHEPDSAVTRRMVEGAVAVRMASLFP